MTASMSSSRRPTDHRPRQLKRRRLPRQQPAPVSHCSVKKPRLPPYCPLWKGPCWVPRELLSKIKTQMLVTLARDKAQARTSKHQAYVDTRQPAGCTWTENSTQRTKSCAARSCWISSKREHSGRPHTREYATSSTTWPITLVLRSRSSVKRSKTSSGDTAAWISSSCSSPVQAAPGKARVWN